MPVSSWWRGVRLPAWAAVATLWLGLAGAGSVAFGDPAAPGEATAYQITPGHTGVTKSGGVVSPQPAPLWIYPVTGAASYPLIAGGRVFLTYRVSENNFAGNYLVALDAKSGQVLWGPVVIGLPWTWTNATYEANRLFIVDYRGTLSSFDAATGTLLWSRMLPAQSSFTSPPTARNGLVYLGGSGSGGTLYGVDQATGALRWLSTVNDARGSSPAVAADGLYVTYHCGQAHKFDPLNGRQIWQYRLNCEGFTNNTAVFANGRLYARQPDYGFVFGTVLGPILSGDSGSLLGSFTADQIPAISDNRGYFMVGGTLQARDVLSQSVAWSFRGDGMLTSAPIVVDDHVFVGSSLGNLYGLDAATGLQLWSTNVGHPIPAPDEYNVSSQPLTGLAAAGGLLVVPTATEVVAYSLFEPGSYPDQSVAYPDVVTKIDVLANDAGFRNPVSVVVGDGPAHGIATVTGSPGTQSGVRIVYTANAHYNGPDTFTYRVTDGTLGGAATVAIDVRPASAGDDVASTPLGTLLRLEVLANDYGFNDPVTLSVVSGPGNGTVVVTDEAIQYTPYPSFSGADAFIYRVTDGSSTATATVAITVLPYRARDDAYRVYRGISGTVPLRVLDNDVGFTAPVNVAIQVPPDQRGLAVVSGPAGLIQPAYINYRPSQIPGLPAERFTYRVTDGVRTTSATVTVTLVDHIANDDVATTRTGEAVRIPVGANDIGFDAPAAATIYSPPSQGTVTVDGPPGEPGATSITYQPAPGFEGFDVFRYQLNDGTHDWIGTVRVSVIRDQDGDFIADSQDNCTQVPNPNQCDSDGDEYGNDCDGDLNNNGFTNAQDAVILRSLMGDWHNEADLDCDGGVNAQDHVLFRKLLGRSPGPSWIDP